MILSFLQKGMFMMKKYVALLLAAIMALALYGCADNTPAAPETEDPASGTETPETPDALDYANTGISDWVYGVADTDEEITKNLMTIDMTEYGTAGASLKQAASGVAMLSLIGQEQFGEKAAAYLDGMNDLQRDYFSFQWQMTAKTAEAILSDFEGQKAMLADAGHEDFTVEGLTAEDLAGVQTQMNILLADRGVTDQWKNFPELEPFFLLTQDTSVTTPAA